MAGDFSHQVTEVSLYLRRLRRTFALNRLVSEHRGPASVELLFFSQSVWAS